MFNPDKQIAGLFFAPSKLPAEYKTPGYADLDSFDEKEVIVGTGEWKLPGTLTIPKGQKECPAVILVHGSGPNDRDESIGPNKPFKDIAWGLASKKIAVLRYEKRTREHQKKLSKEKTPFTVKQESIDDALEAFNLLYRTPGIKKDSIFFRKTVIRIC